MLSDSFNAAPIQSERRVKGEWKKPTDTSDHPLIQNDPESHGTQISRDTIDGRE